MGRAGFLVVAAAVAAGVGYLAVRVYRGAQPEECYACQRAIHAHSRTVAVTHGHRRVFCCPACALSEQQQEHKPVEVKELTSFLTGASLSPATAYVVEGSDVNMCARAHELVDADKRAAGIHYDRCAPSLLAFGEKAEAVAFSREHGGTVQSFTEVASRPNGGTPAPAVPQMRQPGG